jgi:hypothetical protein
LTTSGCEGNLDNVPDTVPAGHSPALPRVIAAARVALDGEPGAAALTPLTPLETVAVVRSLARSVEEGLREAVQRARQAGHTWAELGELLGTTRQAAFWRFGRRRAHRPRQLRPRRAGLGPVLPEQRLMEAAVSRLIIDGADLVVGLSWLEKLGAAHGNVRVPLQAVRSVVAEPQPWGVVRGSKLAGTGIRGVAVLGTRYFGGGRDFVAVTKGRPAVRVDLSDDASYARLLVSVSDADSTVAMIRGATGV